MSLQNKEKAVSDRYKDNPLAHARLAEDVRENPQSYSSLPSTYSEEDIGPSSLRSEEPSGFYDYDAGVSREVDFTPKEDPGAIALAEATGLSYDQAEIAMQTAGFTVNPVSNDVKKEVADGETPPDDSSDPAQPDYMDNNEMLKRARENVFGKGSAFEAYGDVAASAMDQTRVSQNRLNSIAKLSRDTSDRQRNYLSQAQAETLRQQIANEDAGKREVFIKMDQNEKQKDAYEEFYGTEEGKEGRITKWLAKQDEVLGAIESTATTGKNVFGFGNWQETLRTIGAVVAMGAQFAGKYALEKKGLGAAMPNVVMPLIMKGIEADMRRDENLKSDARGQAADSVSLVNTFQNVLKNKNAAINAYTKSGLELVKLRLGHILKQMPEGPDARKNYIQNIIDQATQEQLKKEMGLEEHFSAEQKKYTEQVTNYNASIRNADSSKTARGMSQLNALKVLESKGKEKSEERLWSKDDYAAEEAERGFLRASAEIRNLASAVLAEAGGKLGGFKQIVLMSIQDITDKLGDDMPKGLATKLSTLQSAMEAQARRFAKTFEKRLSNEDMKDYKAIFGTLQTASLTNALANHQNFEYMVRESYLTRMAVAMQSGDFVNNLPKFAVTLGTNPYEAVERFNKSINSRIKMGAEGAHRRLDVGLVRFEVVLQEGQENSALDSSEISELVNSMAHGSFKTDFDHYTENKERQATRNKNPQSQSIDAGDVRLPGSPGTPGKNPVAKDKTRKIGKFLDNYRVTSRMSKPGEFRTIGNVSKPHNGVDFEAAVGTKLYSPFRGKIIEAVEGGNKIPNGNFIRIYDEVSGDTYTFIHLNKFAKGLKVGDTFEEGEVIALTGKSGKGNRAPHLHVQVRDSGGNLVDPLTRMNKNF